MFRRTHAGDAAVLRPPRPRSLQNKMLRTHVRSTHKGAGMMKRTLTSMGVGMLIGAGLVYFIVHSQLSHMKPGLTPGVIAEQKWCDPGHTVPYIAASQCGGGSSCDRAQF